MNERDSDNALTIEILDAVDQIMEGVELAGIDRGLLERLLSQAWLAGRKSGLEAAQRVYSSLLP